MFIRPKLIFIKF